MVMTLRSTLDDMLAEIESPVLEARSPCHIDAPLSVLHLPGELQVCCKTCQTDLLEIIVSDRPRLRSESQEIRATCHPDCGLIVRYAAGSVRIYCFHCNNLVGSYRVEEDVD